MITNQLPASWRAVHILHDNQVSVFFADHTTPEKMTLPPSQYAALVDLWHETMRNYKPDREYSAELRVVAMALRRRSEQERNWLR